LKTLLEESKSQEDEGEEGDVVGQISDVAKVTELDIQQTHMKCGPPPGNADEQMFKVW
jgi:hypothetical protein